MLGKSTDYGLSGDFVLKVANTDDTNFLVQAEIKAIKQGLQYKEKEYDNGSRYKGYLNKDGQREGVGILITAKG
jgi:hypothetical protein